MKIAFDEENLLHRVGKKCTTVAGEEKKINTLVTIWLNLQSPGFCNSEKKTTRTSYPKNCAFKKKKLRHDGVFSSPLYRARVFTTINNDFFSIISFVKKKVPLIIVCIREQSIL